MVPVSETRFWVQIWAQALDKAELAYQQMLLWRWEYTCVCPSLVQCLLDLLDKCCAGWAGNSIENLVFAALLSIHSQLEKEKQNKTKNLNKKAEN